MGEDFETSDSLVAFGGRLFNVQTPRANYNELYIPLYGTHQTDNAATALVATEAFFDRELDHDTVNAALGGDHTAGPVRGRAPQPARDSRRCPQPRRRRRRSDHVLRGVRRRRVD